MEEGNGKRREEGGGGEGEKNFTRKEVRQIQPPKIYKLNVDATERVKMWCVSA